MLASREVLSKVSELANFRGCRVCDINDVPFSRLFWQGKIISQVIAYVWRYSQSADRSKREAACCLREYFINPQNIKKLWGATPNLNGSYEDKLLYAVFPFEKPEDWPDGYFFPIFNESELEYYEFVIDVNNFQGTIEDANLNTPTLMKLLTPFPPRPQLDVVTVTEQELEDWIVDRNPRKMIADNPYIPTCTS